mgnify:CR=1 FL=1
MLLRVTLGPGACLHGAAQFADRRFCCKGLLECIVKLSNGFRLVDWNIHSFCQAVTERSRFKNEIGHLLTQFIGGALVGFAQWKGEQVRDPRNEAIGEVVQHFMQPCLDVMQQILAGPLKQWQFIFRGTIIMLMLQYGTAKLEEAEYIPQSAGQRLFAFQAATQ